MPLEMIFMSGATSFLEVLGDSPTNKVLDFLIENDRTSWSMNEIRDNANVGYSTLKLILPIMLKNDLIEVDKKIGKIKLYVIKKDGKIVKKIYELYNEINTLEINKLISQ